MLKSLFAAIAIATAVTGAAALADGKGTDIQSASAVIEGREGHVDCRDQVWPNIDSQCLSPVSEQLSVRSARVVEM
ncbi:hypothetical protein [Salaquimonas pukyongi]|uniref:hypothetical protein n=1 Tax=Salaquimonas pukyongi TaxID=2712698 RepID=UPI00096B8E95|nr:hypothetical protein [Salaquimonas pukyongi]